MKGSRWRLVMNLKDAQEKTTVLQSKLYQTARKDPHRRFHQLYDKLFREDILWSAWDQVRRNGGAPGIDGVRIADIAEADVAQYLTTLSDELRRQAYLPPGVRRVEIPKGNGKTRVLGIPTVRDRIVQTAVKLVLEPIFEADFCASSFGFRPGVGQPEALAGVAVQKIRLRVGMKTHGLVIALWWMRISKGSSIIWITSI